MSDSHQELATGDLSDVKNGPLAKAGSVLIGVYLDYQDHLKAGAVGPFSSKHGTNVQIVGTNVGILVRGTDLTELTASLNQLGMQIRATDPQTRSVEGFLPISHLPIVAQNPSIVTILPTFKPSHLKPSR